MVLYGSGSQTGVCGPLGGHWMALGSRKEILEYEIILTIILPVCKSGLSYLNYDVFKK